MNTVANRFYICVQENILDVNIIDADNINVKIFLNMCIKSIGYAIH